VLVQAQLAHVQLHGNPRIEVVFGGIFFRQIERLLLSRFPRQARLLPLRYQKTRSYSSTLDSRRD
jgi:hypothetical protein